jgi:hypothetical protein
MVQMGGDHIYSRGVHQVKQASGVRSAAITHQDPQSRRDQPRLFQVVSKGLQHFLEAYRWNK